MSDFFSSAAQVTARIKKGEVSARELAVETLDRIEKHNPDLGIFLTVTPDAAISTAESVDARIRAGDDPGPLAGVTVGLKDNLCTRGIPTTAGSRILEGHTPLYDATVVKRLRTAGCVAVGKTNLDEFAMGSSNENSAYGPVKNPWNRDRVPGGSSGGSAAAVASGMVTLSLGSDTGGSIRQPASFCGVYGLKPTYGRISRFGLIAFASSLDQIGGFSRDIESLSLLYQAIAGGDDRDATASTRTVEPVDFAAGVDGLRLGMAGNLLQDPGVEPTVAARTREAAAILTQAGATERDCRLPDPGIAISAYYLLATAEASSNLARYDGVRYGLRVPDSNLTDMYRKTRSEGFGVEVKRRIMLGTFALSAGYYDAYYARAQRTRDVLTQEFKKLFQEVDLILLPTSPTTAFGLGERTQDPLAMYLADVFTVYANLAGLPGISIPMGEDQDGLPVGVQLLAPRWQEDLLFRAAGVLERTRGKPGIPPGLEDA